MIGLDTNILVRYSIRDDAEQARAAVNLIGTLSAENKGFVSLPVVVEYHLVLSRVYKQPIETIAKAVLALLKSPSLVVQCANEIEMAITNYPNTDLADAVITELGKKFGCTTTMTFDKRAAHFNGLTLLT